MSEQKEMVKKTCKHCQSEIPKAAKVCPVCCRKVKGGKIKWVVIGLVVVAIFAGTGDTEEGGTKKVGSVDNTVDSTNVGASENSDNKQTESVKTEFGIGDIVEGEDLRISFLSAEDYVSDNQFIQPKEGHRYLKFTFEFENIGEDDQHISSWDFNCYADGYECEQTYIDEYDLSADLSTGKKTKGTVVFEIPEGCSKVELEYETNMWTEDKIVFVVTE